MVSIPAKNLLLFKHMGTAYCGQVHGQVCLSIFAGVRRLAILAHFCRRCFVKQVIILVVIGAILFSSIGCATMFYPSRTRQQRPGTLYTYDFGMMVVDILFTPFTLGWLIDTITGAIWIPYHPDGRASSERSQYERPPYDSPYERSPYRR